MKPMILCALPYPVALKVSTPLTYTYEVLAMWQRLCWVPEIEIEKTQLYVQIVRSC